MSVVEEMRDVDEWIDVNCADVTGRTPLMLSAVGGHLRCVKILLTCPRINVNCRGTQRVCVCERVCMCSFF